MYVLAFLIFASTEVFMRLFTNIMHLSARLPSAYFNFLHALIPVCEMFRTTKGRATMAPLN
jgi:hypothetical protein